MFLIYIFSFVEGINVSANVVVAWLTLLLRTRGVPNSKPGYRLSWLRFFVIFLSPPRRMPGYYRRSMPRPFPSKYFPIRYSLTTISFDASVTEKAPLNELQIPNSCFTTIKKTDKIILSLYANLDLRLKACNLRAEPQSRSQLFKAIQSKWRSEQADRVCVSLWRTQRLHCSFPTVSWIRVLT
jgi:hypothetical protein